MGRNFNIFFFKILINKILFRLLSGVFEMLGFNCIFWEDV